MITVHVGTLIPARLGEATLLSPLAISYKYPPTAATVQWARKSRSMRDNGTQKKNSVLTGCMSR